MEIAANARTDDGTPLVRTEDVDDAVSRLTTLFREGQEAREFRSFDPVVMAVTVRAAIDRNFRHGMRVLTFVWGCAGLLNVIVTLAAAYLLPLDLAPGVLNASWPVIVVPTFLFHLYYTKKWDLRA
jgi:hypothetical protein